MRILYFILSLGIISAIVTMHSCVTDDDEIIRDSDGVVVRQPELWKTSISDDNELSQIVVATPIVTEEGNVLVGSRKNSERAIVSLASTNGSVNWVWNDLLSLWSNPNYEDPLTLYSNSYHTAGNRLFFTYTSSSYCVDLSTGETLWKHKLFRHRFDRNSGFNNTYFTSGSTYDPIDEEKIYYGDILSSDEEQLLLIPDYTTVPDPPVNARGHISSMRPFSNDETLFIAFGISNPSKDFTIEGLGLTELNLYDITNKKYVYKKVGINPSRETFGIAHMIYEAPNLYFQSLNFIHCYNAMTGEQLWRIPVGQPPLLSSMILADNKLYSACEDRFLYCIDAATGRLLWKEQNTGTCSELSFVNGVLYYLGGGDGLLHAVDAETGKHLWRVKSPDLTLNSGAWFYGNCTAVRGKDGKKGIVVATTGLHAYGFEAIR